MSSTQANSGGTQANESEITRLQKLPGFNQLQRTLFFNMMAAKPDNSVNNVRVAAVDSRKGKREEKGSVVKSGIGHLQLSFKNTNTSVGGQSEYGGGDQYNNAYYDEIGEFIPQGLSDLNGKEDPSLEVETIKKISQLVIERDGGGWNKVLERRALEARQQEILQDKKKNANRKKNIGKW